MKSRSRDEDEDRDEAEDRRPRRSRDRDEDDNGGGEREERSTRRSRDEDEDDHPAKGKSSGNSKASASSNSHAKGRDRDHDDDNGGDGDPDAPINLEDADESSVGRGEVVPRGKYLCRVEETEFVEFKTGSKGMKVRLEVIEGEYAASKTRKRGKTFYTNIVCSAAAADLLKASLKALGVEKKVYNNPSFRPSMLQRLADEGDLVGNEVVADVKIRTYEGEKQNEVRRMLLPSEAGGDKAEGKGTFLED
jgi:hypothetical protein